MRYCMSEEFPTKSRKKWFSYEFDGDFRHREHGVVDTTAHQFHAANIEIMQLEKDFFEDLNGKYFEVRSLSSTNDSSHWKNEIQNAKLRRKLTSVLVHNDLRLTRSQLG